MSDLYVTEDSYGGLHLYLCNQSRPSPLAQWHGFRSYQDLADFLTFGLRGPAVDPLEMSVIPAYAFEVVQPVGVNTDQTGDQRGGTPGDTSATHPGGEVGSPGSFARRQVTDMTDVVLSDAWDAEMEEREAAGDDTEEADDDDIGIGVDGWRRGE